jgi:ankyrin repeat protein
MDVAPEALKIGDKYGDLPIHRAALQNRLSHAEDVMRLLRDADPSTLIKKDGWKRTPLVCALESGRGVPSAAVVEILLGHDGEPGSITNKKGKSPLDIVSSRKDKVSDEDRAAIISKLSVFTKQ